LVRRRIDEAARAMNGTLIAGDGGGSYAGAAIDSRRVAGGELFFALPGERTDGHRFVGAALAAGAAGAVVDRGLAELDLPAPAPGGPALLRVADAYRGLHDLTRAVRSTTPRHLVGLTGSVGKTTTKELLAAMLARRFRTAASPGNLNNLLGFPLALLAIPADTEWMVAEMGMSTPGELGELSRLARPDAAVLLNVRPAHLESFSGLAALAEAKAEILAGLAPGGLLVANADDPEVVRVSRRHRGRRVFFGAGPAAEVRARDVVPLDAPGGGSRFVLEHGGGSEAVVLPLHGRYNVDNALAAAACALALGVPAGDVAAALAAARPAAGRGVVHRLPGGVTVVDDSYNSSPEAVARALAGVADLPARRRWAVLGDMLELGPTAPGFHREAGERAVAAGFSPLAGVGELARELVAAAAGGGAEAVWFATAAEAAAWAEGVLAPGDAVLVKGSRKVGLEVVVERLLAAAGGRG
jgi:UDP-N-acetylmuramoyl-tripeptide--D-alanyl-D-alanine ligase